MRQMIGQRLGLATDGPGLACQRPTLPRKEVALILASLSILRAEVLKIRLSSVMSRREAFC